jgi:hypothetical protein
MHDVFVAAEKAVRDSCRYLCMAEADARKIVRGEIDANTLGEIISELRWGDYVANAREFMAGKAPLVFRGISFYRIHDLPVPWRVIGLCSMSNGRPAVSIREGAPVDAEVG